jgi:ABC-type cobalamin/Fe3+-siderophores transport system ATPase subunit
VNHLTPCRENHFDSEQLEKLLKIEHCEIEDSPVIMLDGKPIEGLSPGQRCSTLIPIILLESASPLIIDQPEDNLDNKLVFDLVVDILRSLKQKRQIIVATHNPNIPVSGDAEQVVVYETVSRDEGHILHQGAIDDDKIIKDIKAIMEGSDDAFRIRAEKYGYQLSSRLD